MDTKSDVDSDNREHKIRKTDDATTKSTQSVIQVLKEEKKKQEESERGTNQSTDDLAQSIESASELEQKPMVIANSPEPEPTNNMDLDEEDEDDEDTGEIHIVGIEKCSNYSFVWSFILPFY